jgi:hypothetical protein
MTKIQKTLEAAVARIRSIKPEFWSSEQVMECARDTRLLFIGLWNFVDDAGRMSFSPKQIKALIFPSDDLSVGQVTDMLEELCDRGLIETYEVSDKRYLAVTGWKKHQRIDKPQPARCPGPIEEPIAEVRRPFEECSANARDGEERKREEGSPDSRSLAGASGPGAGDAFEEFWTLRLKRDGPDPREPARRAFAAAVRAGADPSAIIAGMRRFAEVHADKRGTRYVARTEKWLLEKTWEDYAAPVLLDPRSHGQVWLRRDDERFKAWDRYFLAQRKRGAPTDARGGWLFTSEWPPGDPRGERREPGVASLPFLNAVRAGGGSR